MDDREYERYKKALDAARDLGEEDAIKAIMNDARIMINCNGDSTLKAYKQKFMNNLALCQIESIYRGMYPLSL